MAIVYKFGHGNDLVTCHVCGKPAAEVIGGQGICDNPSHRMVLVDVHAFSADMVTTATAGGIEPKVNGFEVAE